MSINPYMMILKADPPRYIQKPAPTVLVLAKTVEGVFALLGLLRIGSFLLDSLGSFSTAQILSITLTGRALQVALGLQQTYGSLFLLATLGVFAALVCTVVEAVGLWALRIALVGSALLKQVQRVLFYDCILLLLITVGGLGFRWYRYATTEMGSDPSFHLLRTILLTGAVSLAVLVLLTLYHRDVYMVLSAIEYEIRMEFKETLIDAPRLGVLAFLFGALSTGGAVLAAMRLGWMSLTFLLLAVLAVKYFALISSWEGFRQCHR